MEEVKKQKNVINNLLQKIGPNLTGNGNNYGISEEARNYLKIMNKNQIYL